MASVQKKVNDTPFRIAVSASFTAEPLLRPLMFWSGQLNREFDVRFAPYNQILQTLLDRGGEFASNTHGVNVALVRVEDLGHLPDGGFDLERIEANVRQLLDAVRSAPEQGGTPLVFILCPASDAFLEEPLRRAFSDRMDKLISQSLQEATGVQCIDHHQIQALYPVDRRTAGEGERLGRIPYTEMYFCVLATIIVRFARALLAPPYKVIVTDCDNTLWKGICGEDGPAGVALDPPRRALHEFLLEQHEAGALLAMASKNNEQDVFDTFAEHPEFPLQLRHFTAWRLNWESKVENLLSLADELSLGLDSFVFLDDSPKECAEVEDGVPEVLTLVLPDPVEHTPHFLRHVWAFDRPVVTEEDRQRSVYYRQQERFGSEVRQAADLEHFMATLQLDVRFPPLTPERLARVAQLTQRTNQFNFTTIRRMEAGISALVLNEGFECLTIDVSDRFGEYGLVGVVLFREGADALEIDTFLLSCRVLGRGVEHRVMARLGEMAAARGLAAVTGELRFTAKNLPARQFLESLGRFEPIDGGLRYRIPAEQASGVRWRPSTPEGAAPKRDRKVHRRPLESIDFGRIARELSTPEQIREAVRRSRVSQSGFLEMSDTERQLAQIWSDLLERDIVRREDNFFDLGGHSLLAVLLILRVKEAFGIELPIDDVYTSGLTLADLAARIELYRETAGMDPAEYAKLLDDIEHLSDEEVRELLARGDSGSST